MKQYDSINYYGDHWGLPGIGFDKPDGSNMRFEWSRKRGFYKFGTRGNMIDRSQEQFGFAIDLFLDKYADGLDKAFRSPAYRNSESFVAFAELTGTKSCFGWHDYGNDAFDVTLFDVNEYKKGFVKPKQFVGDFGHLGIPRIVYEGNLNKELVAAVKRNDFGLDEGIVFKGVAATKKGKPLLYCCKIKTDDWFDRLRAKDLAAFEREAKEQQQHTGLILL